MGPYGHVKKSLLKPHKNRAAYWTKILKGAGWIEDKGDYWELKSYREVWSILKVGKCVTKRKNEARKRNRFVYKRLLIEATDPKLFFKEALEAIQYHLIERKKKQITRRLTVKKNLPAKLIRETEKPLLSCSHAAEILGYSPASLGSGHKLRKKYFTVYSGGRTTTGVNRRDEVGAKTPCSRVSLRRIKRRTILSKKNSAAPIPPLATLKQPFTVFTLPMRVL